MRYLILSDIHSNLEALTAVLVDADGHYDRIVNCGDLVGYGPDPNAVVDWSRESGAPAVRGNHDKACASLTDLEWFNPVARASDEWTHGVLQAQNLAFLKDLSMGPQAVNGFSILHGSPQDEDEYIVNELDVEAAIPHLAPGVSFFGHTHLQGGFEIHRTVVRRTRPDYFEVNPEVQYLVNPGSVGQPRDGDWRAGYALYNTAERLVVYKRCEYDVASTFRKIIEAGLPEVLGRRLYVGW